MPKLNPWTRIGWDAWMLGVEAATVINLRGQKMAMGGDPQGSEVQRMVAEKIDAALALQTLALTGGLGFGAAAITGKTLKHYRRKVRANRRRLLR